MDFFATKPYAEVCIEYALAYSKEELHTAFEDAVARICARHKSSPYANSKPIRITHDSMESELSPTSIEDGLWHFFAGGQMRTNPHLPFAVYYQELKALMVQCYVPFREFNEDSFRDSMRLRVYKDSTCIIVGTWHDEASRRKYSLAKMKNAFGFGKASTRPYL